MNIRVNLSYIGNEGTVERGLYAQDDSRLLGLATYLLSAGHASLTSEALPPDTVPFKDESETGAISDIAALRQRYQTLANKKPFAGWGADILEAKIAELEAPEPSENPES